MKKCKKSFDQLISLQNDLNKLAAPITWARECSEIAGHNADRGQQLFGLGEEELLVSEKQMLLGAVLWVLAACVIGFIQGLQHLHALYLMPARSYEELKDELEEEEEEGE